MGGIIPLRIEEDNSSGNSYIVKQISLAAQPIRSTTQILVVTRHPYGMVRSFLRSHFAKKPVMASRDVD